MNKQDWFNFLRDLAKKKKKKRCSNLESFLQKLTKPR